MYCISIAYPRNDDDQFDFAYFTEKHIPMVCGFLGTNAVKSEIRKGVATLDGSPASFVCLANIWIRSVEEFQDALGKHGAEIIGDIPNYTNIQPILQVDEVLA